VYSTVDSGLTITYGINAKHIENQSSRIPILRFFQISKNAFHVFSTAWREKTLKNRQQKFSPQSFEMSSQLCHSFTHNFLPLVSYYLFVMVNQLFMAEKPTLYWRSVKNLFTHVRRTDWVFSNTTYVLEKFWRFFQKRKRDCLRFWDGAHVLLEHSRKRNINRHIWR